LQQIIYKNQLTFILIDIVLDISNNKRMQSFDYVHDDQYTPKNKFTLSKLKYLLNIFSGSQAGITYNTLNTRPLGRQTRTKPLRRP